MTSTFASEALLCQYLQQRYNRIYRRADALPLPFCIDKRRVRAIVLGTDPSNPQGTIKTVFGLENPDSPYFRAVRDNLKRIGLSMEDVYVQNLCKNYFQKITSRDPAWREIAALWRELLRRELDDLFGAHIPVLITARALHLVLAFTPAPGKPSDLYRDQVVLAASENHLGRTVIPFFKHWYYNLERWQDYRDWIKSLV